MRIDPTESTENGLDDEYRTGSEYRGKLTEGIGLENRRIEKAEEAWRGFVEEDGCQ